MSHTKNIKIKLKYTKPNYEELEKHFRYPIDSFLNGDGSWTYNDIDLLYMTYRHCDPPYIPLRRHKTFSQKYIYCNLKLISYICKNNGKICHKNKNEDRHMDSYPSIGPNDLLDIKTWKKIYYCQKGHNDDQEWVIFCKTSDNVYIYLRASCDYTGFDCQGGGMISFSKNKQYIWSLGLDNFGRTLTLQENGVKMQINMK